MGMQRVANFVPNYKILNNYDEEDIDKLIFETYLKLKSSQQIQFEKT